MTDFPRLVKPDGVSEPLAGDDDGNLKVTTGSGGAQLGSDIDFAFGAEDGANTQVVQIITAPETPAQEYAVVIHNPSTYSDLTVKAFAVELTLDGANTRDAFITEWQIPKAQSISGTTIQTYLNLIHGAFMEADLKLVISNNTTLAGAAPAFIATARVRAVTY